jgi:uncharacterized membrane protein
MKALTSAGLMLGAGLGGFFDGIVFHQLLQWHNMLSARVPPDTMDAMRFNMLWDGVFHAAVWCLTLAGVWRLFTARARRDEPWSRHTLLGGMACGWGGFNLVEGLVDHQWLGLHHVMERASDHAPADLSFLASGVLLLALGAWLLRRGAARAAALER